MSRTPARSSAHVAAALPFEALEPRRLMAYAATVLPDWGLPAFDVASAATREATPLNGGPSVAAVRPANNALAVARDAFVALDIALPDGAVDPSTVSSATVFLRRTSDNAAVTASPTVSGGGDAITLTPTALLAANTQYTFTVTSGVKDVNGVAFTPFSSAFTTGTRVAESLSRVAFDKVPQASTSGTPWTGVTVGPDGKLYATTSDGEIHRFDLAASGNLTNGTLLSTLVESDGTTPRLITGMTFDTAQPQLTAYVSHGAYVDPANDQDRNAAEWSGKITRLTGASLAAKQDVVVNLPRSVYDHLNNQPVFGPDGKLYWVQPSNTAMGAPDSTWGNRPEKLLSAAVLAADVRTIGSPLDVKTAEGGTYNPYAAGAKVTIYATGIRNAYDLVWTDGDLYAPSNGSAAGGNAPAGPGNNPPAINGVNETQHDLLFKIVPGGYYGHPNPLRGEYVLGGGNPTSGQDASQVSQYPVGTQPDSDFKGFAYDFGLNVSPNGAIVYNSGGVHFGGALDGKLLVTRFSGGDDVMILERDSSSGNMVAAYAGSFGTGGLSDPLDVVQDPATGNLYVVEAGFRTSGGNLRITLLKPLSSGVLSAASPARNYGNGNTLFFSGVNGQTADDPLTIALTNTGNGTLAFPDDAVTFRGPGASRFSVVSGDPAGVSLAQNASRNLLIDFDPTAIGIVEAELVIKSNAAGGDLVYKLRGLGTAGTGGNLEPSLQRLLDLYGLDVDVADPDPATTAYPQQIAVAGSDEVTAQLFEKAGSGNVTVEVLASMGTANANAFTDTSRLAWYYDGASNSPTNLFSVPKSDAQTVQVAPSGSLSFDPGAGANFGLAGVFNDFGPRTVYQQDSLNTWENNAGERRKLRLFPLKDAAGNVVANAYVFAFEEFDAETDQNDLVGIIRNVKLAESRPSLTLVNAADGVFGSTLTMSRIQYQDSVVGNKFRDRATLVVRNDGDASVNITGVSIDTTDFVVESGGGAGSLAPGQSRNVVVKFVYSNATQRSTNGDGDFFPNEPGDDIRPLSRLVRTGTLTVSTDDPAAPEQTAALGGLWQSHSEEGNTGTSQEPVLNELVAAFGWDIDVGPFTGQANYGTGQNTQGQRIALGEEILSDYFKKADTGANVGVIQIAAYHQQRDPQFNGSNTPRYQPNTAFKWYNRGGSRNQVFKHDVDYSQSLLPLIDGEGGLARGTFNPGSGDFGISVDNTWNSDHTLNLQNAHSIRWFALKDADGNVIPNAYLAAEDNAGTGDGTGNDGTFGSNYDHQDNVYILTNVRPAAGAAAVKNLAATSTGAGVELTWTAAPEGNVTSYRVERATSSGGTYTTVATVETPGHVDASAAIDTTYFYRVVAVDYHGTSGTATAPVSATRTSGPTVPATPTNFTATATTSDSVALAWTDNSSQETGYRVYRSIDGGNTYALIKELGANVQSTTDTNVVGGTAYAYRVRAFNANGESAFAAEVVTTPQNLSAPVAVSATANAFNRVTITWADASDNETGFRVERRTGDNAFATVGTVGANVQSFVDNTAAGGATYDYRVVTLGSPINGGTSSVASATTPSDPSSVVAPANLASTSTAHNGVTLSWTFAGDNADGFEVLRGNVVIATLNNAAARAYTDATVTAETSYAYAVRAFNVEGQTTYRSPSSSTLNVTTPADPSILTAPANFTATAVTRSQVDLDWDGVPNASFYVVQRRAGSGVFETIATSVPASQTDYVDSTAAAGTTYEYRVRARNASNPDNGPFATVSVTTVAADAIVFNRVGTAVGTLAGNADALSLAVSGFGVSTGTADNLGFAGRLFTGNFDVTLRVDSFNAAGSDSQAGLMARGSLDPNARTAFVRYNGTTGMLARSTVGGGAGLTNAATVAAPVFLRLTRTGDTFAGQWSSNGTTWSPISSPTIAMGDTVYVGAALASNNAGESTASFANFGSFQQTAPAAPTGLTATNAGGVRLTWSDNANNEASFRVERRTSGSGAFAALATVAADTVAYTDATAVNGRSYDYRVVAVNAAGENASGTATIALPSTVPPAPGGGTAPATTERVAAAIVRPGVGLGWQPTSGDAAGYVVERRTGGGDWGTLSRVNSAAASLRDATATPGVIYDYRVRAFNDDGVGEATDVVTLAAPNVAPSVVANLVAERTAAGVALNFDEVDADVEVQRRIGNSGWATLGLSDDGDGHLDEGAPYGVDVAYRVRPVGGDWSNVAIVAAASEPARPISTGQLGDASGVVTFVREFVHVDMTAVGGDAWSFEDGVVFAGFDQRGDFDVAVRVKADGSVGSMAGLMVRATDDPSAANVYVKRQGNSVVLTRRLSSAGQTASAAALATDASWLRLARRGDTVHALASADGVTWLSVGSVSVPNLGANVRLGLAAAGGVGLEDGAVDVRFREFRHLRGGDGPATIAATAESGGVRVTWPASPRALWHTLERRGAGEAWTAIARIAGGSFLDATAEDGEVYLYRVAIEDGRPSATSAAVTA